LGVVGVLCVEFFLTENGRLLLNEIAPRPHNSGHLTIEACPTSQFEQQLRAICGLPLGDTRYLKPAAMANLLGDLWFQHDNPKSEIRNPKSPDWTAVLAHHPAIKLHLYGKTEAAPAEKWGTSPPWQTRERKPPISCVKRGARAGDWRLEIEEATIISQSPISSSLFLEEKL
jgi:5-(carboxyamino)imidazole ribonucleotide synthase